ncbi:YaiI/YqxD family protein [Rhodovulum strictum]|uniref:UPF0178 protein GH815_08285 n=1 Tax=Rhodovulum strictum TaxID=58314 RepID=A0A844B5L8_9RHOB|nr:YaiI/YqxD family protein [Rhodovulum strictum]
MSRVLVDADACPVKAEALRVVERHGAPVLYVANGGLRPVDHPLARMVYVAQGPDEADKWIADQAGPGDVVVTADLPLAAKCVAAGAAVLNHNGEAFTPANIGERLATRDLMADLRAADPFRQGSGRGFAKADRTRFLDALERALRAARPAAGASHGRDSKG